MGPSRFRRIAQKKTSGPFWFRPLVTAKKTLLLELRQERSDLVSAATNPLTHLNVGIPGSCHTCRVFQALQLPGTAMDAIDFIQRDHRNLYSVVYAMDFLAKEAANSSEAVNYKLFALMLEYVGEFQDQYHHPKEDEFLFPAMARYAPSLQAVLARLEQDHQVGYQMRDNLNRAFVRLVGDPTGEKARFIELVREYAAFQREHVSLEEQKVLKTARDVIPPEAMKRITDAFENSKDPMFGEDQSEKFKTLFKRIVQIAPAPMGTGPTAKAV